METMQLAQWAGRYGPAVAWMPGDNEPFPVAVLGG
jgi:hypothetical protein